MPVIDVACWTGGYPYRAVPDHSPSWLLRQMDRLHIDQAWVGYLPAVLYRDPASATGELKRLVEPHEDRLKPVPTVNPAFPRWEDVLNEAVNSGCPAVRVYPNYLGIDGAGGEMRNLAGVAASAGIPLLLTVRLEDLRQRHPLDTAGELSPAVVRALIRGDDKLRLIVSQAERSFIEEVHWGLTPAESARILWDIVWIWGPPEDHLKTVLETIGAERFVFGTGMPLRIPDNAVAKLDLLDLSADQRKKILGENIRAWR